MQQERPTALALAGLECEDARACLARIRDHYQAFWFELRDFHAGRGWVALDYSSFQACVEQELGMSKQRAYQLLAAADVHDNLADGSQEVLTTGILKVGHAEVLAPLPAEEQRTVWADAVRTDAAGKPSVADLRRIVRTRTDEQRAERAARPVAPKPPAPPAPSDTLLAVADARQLPLQANVIDLIVTSPPYALDIAYEGGDVGANAWVGFMADWLAEALRVTKPCGRLALNVPLDTSKPAERPTYAQAVWAALSVGWQYKTTIVWDEGNTTKGNRGLGSVNSAARPHHVSPAEVVAVFFKGEWAPSSDGPDDIAPDEWQFWGRTIWCFPGESRGWEQHPAPFPFELPRRLLRYFSRVGDSILDPFVGSGTTMLAAHRLGRRGFGFDRSAEYVAASRRRLAAS